MKRRNFFIALLALFIPTRFAKACGQCDKMTVLTKNGPISNIDSCIGDLVGFLNDSGTKTLSSCCGHGRTDGYIWCKDKLIILSKETDPEEVKKRYYKEFEHEARGNDRRTKRECS